MEVEFKHFSEIKKYSGIHLAVYQKLHGSNAQIYIYDNGDGVDLRCGSRERWLFPTNDNYGFASFVYKYKAEFIEKLGLGRHYGEWIGIKINSGEGLTPNDGHEGRMFALFNTDRPYPLGLPPHVVLVPELFNDKDFTGSIYDKITEIMNDLRDNGSKLVKGFMRVEGVVIHINGQKRKLVFKAEDTKWKKPSERFEGSFIPKDKIDYSYLLQPIRLEKLLSRDEKYLLDYPKSLGLIVKDYVADLIKEEQIVGDKDQIKAITKGANFDIFSFVKTVVGEKHKEYKC